MQRASGRKENVRFAVWMESKELESLSVKSLKVRRTKANRYRVLTVCQAL